MREQLLSEIKKLEFEKAYELIKKCRNKEKLNILCDKREEEMAIKVYLFMDYLSKKDDNKAFWHLNCANYLLVDNYLIDDNLFLAAWHLEQVVKINPTDYLTMSEIVGIFWQAPVDYFTDEQFYEYAKKIVDIYPDCPNVHEIIKKFSK